MSTAKLTSKDSTDKMIKFAAENLGIDLAGKSRQEVIAQIKLADASVFGGEPDATATEQGDAQTETSADAERELVRVTIQIHDDSGDEGESDNFVQVGLNGIMYQVMKGVEVTVPAGVYHVLNDAVESHYRTVTDPTTKLKTLKETKVKRHPFSVIERFYA